MRDLAAAIVGAVCCSGLGAAAAQTSATATPTPTDVRIGGSTPTPTPTPPGSIRVRVGVDEFTCEGALTDAAVVLEPRGLERRTDDDGVASFTALDPGEYVLRLSPPCRSGSCWGDVAVSVAQDEVEVDLCPPVCGAQVFLAPASGPPGTEVDLEGACQAIHSGGTADLYFGPIRLGAVRGETAGDFRETFTVPYVPAGKYAVAAAGGVAEFRVIGTTPVCPGDCDGDRQVGIAELVHSVGIALQTIEGATCPVFSGGVAIADLVRAVRAALDGCAALALPSPTPGPEAALCRDCCEYCGSGECVARCFGGDGCLLVARMYGHVNDAINGEPIAGAEVTLNGVTAVSAADGSYEVHAERNETCALDYLFALEVRAGGYRTLRNNLYRVPFPDGTWQHTIGLAPLNATPVAALPLRGGAPMQRGKIY